MRQVLTGLLRTDDFTYDVLGILGLERRYEVTVQSEPAKLYLNVLAFGDDCEKKVADLERRRSQGDSSVPRVLAWKESEPLLNGNPFILSDQVI